MENNYLTSDLRKKIIGGFINWYSSNKRHYPWRDNNSPYNILIAEKLLQQTAVSKNVVQAYNNIIESYPDIKSLSEAEECIIFDHINGLGLHYRAKELIKIAKTICQKNQGKIPNDFKGLKSLPGIGNYISNAILCFAYNQNVALVDINIARIFHRIFELGEKLPENPARKKYLIQIARKLLPSKNVSVFNYSLIDFGAIVCTSSKPKCEICPIDHICSFGILRGVKNVR